MRADYALGTTIYAKFTTRRFTTGAPFTLGGSPAVAVYRDGSTMEITSGVTLTVDFDARTGLNHIEIVATSGNGFVAGADYDVVITSGTVDGVSVVGEVVFSFSIEKQSALRPTVAGRTLDVTATGEAGLDLDNTSGTLGAAEIPNLDVAVSTRFAASSYTAPDNAGIAAIKAQTDKLSFDASNRVSSKVDAMGADVLDASALAASAAGEIRDAVWGASSRTLTAATNITSTGGAITLSSGAVTVATNNDKSGYTLTSAEHDAIVDKVWDEATSGHQTAGSAGKALTDAGSAGDPWATVLPGSYGAGTAGHILGNRLDVAVSTRLAASSYTAPDNASIGAVKAQTDKLTFDASNRVSAKVDEMGANVMTAGALASDAVNEIKDAVFAQVIEGSVSFLGAQRIQLAAAAGKTSGFVPGQAGTGTIRDTSDTKTRITAAYDANGNRTSVTLDAT